MNVLAATIAITVAAHAPTWSDGITKTVVPSAQVSLSAKTPGFYEKCILFNPVPPDVPPPSGDNDVVTPVPPGVTPPPVVIVDTSPGRLIGCVNQTTPDPQTRLNDEFPDAIEEDGVLDRSTGNIWVLRGGSWVNVGPNPGPTIVVQNVIPPWNETVVLTAKSRTLVSVTSLNYALELETTLEPITTKTKAEVLGFTQILVNAPAASAAVVANVPIIATGKSAQPPTATISTAGAIFSAGGGSIVESPAAQISLGWAEPAVPRLSTQILTGSPQDVAIATFAPLVVGGGSAVVDAIGVIATALVPEVSAIISALPPAANASVTPLAPAISTGASVASVVAGATIAGATPSAATGAVAMAPAATITTQGQSAIVPRLVFSVEIPAASILPQGTAPTIGISSTTTAPTSIVSATGVAPEVALVSEAAGDYFKSIAAQNYGWLVDVLPDWWGS